MIEDPGPQRRGCAHPAVGGGAAAETHDQITAAEFDRRFHGQADAVRRGLHRVQVAGRLLSNATDFGELDQRGGSTDPDPCRGRLCQRSGGRDVATFEAGRQHGVQGPVAAVGDRSEHHLDRAVSALHAGAQLGTHIGGGKAALELVGCE